MPNSRQGNAIAVGSPESSTARDASGATAFPVINPLSHILPNATICHCCMFYLASNFQLVFHVKVNTFCIVVKIVQNMCKTRSNHVFALFHLLGMKFAPRLRDLPDRKLACFGSPRQWPFLAPLMGSPIKDDVIAQHWGDAIRLAGSAKTKAIKPSATLRKLGG